MRIVFTKGERSDEVSLIRNDGTSSAFRFPHKGPTPHDAIHLFVERELGLAGGFWGLVAMGSEPADIGAMAAAGGHASAKRAEVPDRSIVELLQAERLVECFEAESWSGSADDDGIRMMAHAGWGASHVPPLLLDHEVIGAIRDAIRAFAREWSALPVGDRLALDWPG